MSQQALVLCDCQSVLPARKLVLWRCTLTIWLQYWTRKVYCEQKKNECLFFINRKKTHLLLIRNEKKSRIPWLFCFSFLCEGFVVDWNIIWAVFYLVGNTNMDCPDKQILNNNLSCVQKIKTNWVLSSGVRSCISKRMIEIFGIGYPGFSFYTRRAFTVIIWAVFLTEWLNN